MSTNLFLEPVIVTINGKKHLIFLIKFVITRLFQVIRQSLYKQKIFFKNEIGFM